MERSESMLGSGSPRFQTGYSSYPDARVQSRNDRSPSAFRFDRQVNGHLSCPGRPALAAWSKAVQGGFSVGTIRVIGGEKRGFRLAVPSGGDLRPTSNRVREALFDILSHKIPRARVLDLFAGTGAIGIEALSRGAGHCRFIEKSRAVLATLKRNLEVCDLTSRASILQGEIPRALSRLPELETFDLVFVDPPYGQNIGERVLRALGQTGLLHPRSVVVLEHRKTAPPLPRVGPLSLGRSARYGDTILSFFSLAEDRSRAEKEV